MYVRFYKPQSSTSDFTTGIYVSIYMRQNLGWYCRKTGTHVKVYVLQGVKDDMLDGSKYMTGRVMRSMNNNSEQMLY